MGIYRFSFPFCFSNNNTLHTFALEVVRGTLFSGLLYGMMTRQDSELLEVPDSNPDFFTN